MKKANITRLITKIETSVATGNRDDVTFGGDMMAYHLFISVFNRRVDCMNISDDDKLIHLFDCMEKQSRDAIQNCMIIGGTEGYKSAIYILGNTYGNRHVITEKIKSELCSTKSVRTPADIRSLAHEAANAV